MNEIKIINKNEIINQKHFELGIKPNIDKTIFDVIDEFLGNFKSHDTIRRYKKILNEFFIDTLKFEFLNDFKYIEISNMSLLIQEHIENKTKYDEENDRNILNSNSINNIVYCLRSFFNYLINLYNYPKNPLVFYLKYGKQKKILLQIH